MKGIYEQYLESAKKRGVVKIPPVSEWSKDEDVKKILDGLSKQSKTGI